MLNSSLNHSSILLLTRAAIKERHCKADKNVHICVKFKSDLHHNASIQGLTSEINNPCKIIFIIYEFTVVVD